VFSPGSKIEVWVGDLPNETRQALRLRLAKETAAFTAPLASRADGGREDDPDALAGPAWLLRELSERAASQLESSES
jgi:hypothetical protein